MLKGLLLKDIFVMKTQMKMFLIMIFVFAVIQNFAIQGFALMYASMIPVTAMACDEQAKWDCYARMMPYSTRDMVLSRYLLGMGASMAIAVLELAASLAWTLVKGGSAADLAERAVTIYIVFCAAQVLLSVNLPLIFRLGVEKGRLVYIFTAMLIAMLVVTSVNAAPGVWALSPAVYLAGAVVLATAALTVSISISGKIYRKKYC